MGGRGSDAGLAAISIDPGPHDITKDALSWSHGRAAGKMRKFMFLGLVLAVGCAGSSTGGGGTAGGPSDGAGAGSPNATQAASCSFTETLTVGSSVISITFCSDTSGLTVDQVNALKTSCVPHPASAAGVAISGTYSSGPCPKANQVGGCSVTSGGYPQTAWYYTADNLTADQLRMICSEVGGKFVAP